MKYKPAFPIVTKTMVKVPRMGVRMGMQNCAEWKAR